MSPVPLSALSFIVLIPVTVTINIICHSDTQIINPHPQNPTHVKVLSKDTQGARFAVYPLWPCSGGKPPETPEKNGGNRCRQRSQSGSKRSRSESPKPS